MDTMAFIIALTEMGVITEGIADAVAEYLEEHPEVLENAMAIIGAPEASSTAASAHVPGTDSEYFIYDGKLRKATGTIAQGGSIVTSGSGQNCEEVTVGGELGKTNGEVSELKSAMSNSFDLPISGEMKVEPFGLRISSGSVIAASNTTNAVKIYIPVGCDLISIGQNTITANLYLFSEEPVLGSSSAANIAQRIDGCYDLTGNTQYRWGVVNYPVASNPTLKPFIFTPSLKDVTAPQEEMINHLRSLVYNNVNRLQLQYDYMYWSGSAVATGTAMYNGFIVYIPVGTESFKMIDIVATSVMLFDGKPYVGLTGGTQAIVTSNIVDLTGYSTKRYALITIKLANQTADKFYVAFPNYIEKMAEYADAEKYIDENRKRFKMPTSNKSVARVCFIYDDNSSNDDNLVAWLEARGMVGNFASIGTATPATWSAMGNKLLGWYKKGHGILGHGVPSGITMHPVNGASAGISNCCDSEVHAAIKANCACLDYYYLPHKGLVYFNSYAHNAHTDGIVGMYYDYAFGLGGGGMNLPNTDLFHLTRYNTDNSDMLTGAKALVDSAIGKNCVIAFGGHMAKTAQGGTYSSEADFLALLDYIKAKIDDNLLICVNADNAVASLGAYANAFGDVKSEVPYKPIAGNMVIDNGTVKVCSTSGTAQVLTVAFSGTASAGQIAIEDIGIDIETTESESISDVIDAILAGVYTGYTIRKKDSSTVICYCDTFGEKSTPTVTTNTSGLTVTITAVSSGADPVWI